MAVKPEINIEVMNIANIRWHWFKDCTVNVKERGHGKKRFDVNAKGVPTELVIEGENNVL